MCGCVPSVICVCVCGFLLSGGHMTDLIFLTNHGWWFHSKPCVDIYQSHCDILSKLHSFKRSSIIAIQSLFDYFISLTPFKVIPDPFQSLNTKGSIFKDYFNMFNVIYYFISLTIFKAIPAPFQSLNTKGSIFKTGSSQPSESVSRNGKGTVFTALQGYDSGVILFIGLNILFENNYAPVKVPMPSPDNL
ncbi:hypothetical protein DVH24_018585 [Malus domestica]|uniref:Uncharacterized protein n=1 Tax=Malus domestica TaxID=3750 RepID=A0A498HKI9_MALDO|nr:hypothetical protein DVH24_018585 [Malus domestica]